MNRMLVLGLLLLVLVGSAVAQVYNFFPPPGIRYDSTNHTIISDEPVGVLAPGFSVNSDSANAPTMELIDNTSAANNRKWWWTVSSGVMQLCATSDAGVPGQCGLQMNRSASNITQATVLAGSKSVSVKSSGDVQVNGSSGLAGQPILSGGSGVNAAYGALNLANANAVTGILPQANLLTCAANQVVFDSASAQLTCSSALTWTASTNTASLGSLATPASITTPAGSASAGAALNITTGAGVGVNQLGGAINIIPGANGNTLATTGAAVNITAGSSSNGRPSGDIIETAKNVTLNARGFSVPTQLQVAGSGDLLFSTDIGDPIFFLQTVENPPIAGDFVMMQIIDSVGDGIQLGTLTSVSTCDQFYGSVVPAVKCSFIDTSSGHMQVYAVGGVPYVFEDIDLNYDVPAPAAPFATTDTNGFEYMQTVSGIPTGVPAHTAGVYANGAAFRYDTTNNRLDVYNSGWKQIQAGNLVLSGTTGSIGGGALLAGACTSGTVAITGATTAMSVVATPVTYPGDGTDWKGYISSAGTATVKVCALVAVTPAATTYNVRVLQ